MSKLTDLLGQQPSLAKHNVGILYWSTLFGSINFLTPILTLFYLARGLTTTDIFIVLLFFSISVLVFEVPTGAFADRFGAKTSFIVGCGVGILSSACLLFAHDPWVFYVSSLLQGLAATFFSGADEALIYDSLKADRKEDKMDAVMGKIKSASYIPMILAFLVGPWLAKDLQEHQFMLLIGLGIGFRFIEFFLLFRIKNPRQAENFRDNPFRHVKAGLKTIRQTPNLLYLFINLTLVFIPAAVIFGKFDQPYLTQAGLSVHWLGVMYALGAIVVFFLLQNIAWLTSKMSRTRILQITGGLVFIGMVIAALVEDHLWVACGVFFLIKMSNSIRYPIYSQMGNAYIPSESRATTLSLLSIVDSGFDLLLFTLFASISIGGLSPMFMGAAAVILIGLCFPIREAKQAQQKQTKTIDIIS